MQTAVYCGIPAANEARIYDALARHYGVDCPRRFRDLVDRLNRSRYLWNKDAGHRADDEQAKRGECERARTIGCSLTWRRLSD